MKNFFTSMLGALVALIIFTAGACLLFVGFVSAIAALGSQQKMETVEKGAYLVFDLEANITDSPPLVDLAMFTGNHNETLQLRNVTRALHAAAKDDRIAGVLLKGALTPAGYGSGYAALKDVRNALADFKASGKPVKAYLNFAMTKDYYLASIADEISIDPYGVVYMPGLASEPVFFAGAFEKYGIGVQVTRVGKYKSYVEPYTRKDMSPENREQIQKLLDDVWGSLVADIAKSRGVTAEAIQSTVDAEGMIRPEAAKAAKLIDRIAYRDELIDELKDKTGRKGSKQSFKQISLASYAKQAVDHNDSGRGGLAIGHGDKIALVYAEGAIVDGDGEVGEIGGAKFSKELRSLRQDDNIKAIVLRVNSPGGSASASEMIQRELRLARKVKPVIVSMGSYAASGGYWISTYGDRIFAEPTTITGSIGVFGMQFDIQKLANNIGITFDGVKTGKFADALTITRPKTEEELAVMQRMVDWIYDQFTEKVADSRHLKIDFVKEIAQGRVWSGTEAKKLGLVDEIGGLDVAIKYAAEKAKLGSNYHLVEYPRKKELAEAIGELLEKVTPSTHVKATGLVAQIAERLETELRALKTFNDPQGVYARLPLELSIR
ncbi:MAG: signal peptide peptidase SppA, type [Verrucomicrobia bacterium]|nr:signal peptide peptidase SppA, type [Verrucomicrobiota bacterium]